MRRALTPNPIFIHSYLYFFNANDNNKFMETDKLNICIFYEQIFAGLPEFLEMLLCKFEYSPTIKVLEFNCDLKKFIL